jgi:phage tail collar domain protein
MVSIYELKLGAEKLEILKALSAEIEKAITSIGKIDNSRLNAIYNDILEKANQVLQDKNFVQELKDKVDVAHKDISEKAATINQKFEQQQALLQSMQKLKAEIEALLKSGIIDDTAEKTTTTYSSKKIGGSTEIKNR